MALLTILHINSYFFLSVSSIIDRSRCLDLLAILLPTPVTTKLCSCFEVYSCSKTQHEVYFYQYCHCVSLYGYTLWPCLCTWLLGHNVCPLLTKRTVRWIDHACWNLAARFDMYNARVKEVELSLWCHGWAKYMYILLRPTVCFLIQSSVSFSER